MRALGPGSVSSFLKIILDVIYVGLWIFVSILALFTHEVMRRGLAMGKIGAEASWLLEDNQLIVKPMRAMGARERMRWRVYDRPMTGTRAPL